MFPYSIVIGDCFSGDASLVVNDYSILQIIIGYNWWWTMLVMDVRFLQTFLDLYYYLIDRLLRVPQCTRRLVHDL